MENSPQIVMKPEGFADCHQTLSSWVGSGDETKKCIDLDRMYAKGFHTDNYPVLQQNLEFLAPLKTWQQCSPPSPFLPPSEQCTLPSQEMWKYTLHALQSKHIEG